MSIIDDIIAATAAIRVRGEAPNTVHMNPAIARLRRVCGNSKQRRTARFYNQKRIAFLREKTGLDIFIA